MIAGSQEADFEIISKQNFEKVSKKVAKVSEIAEQTNYDVLVKIRNVALAININASRELRNLPT